MADRLRDSALFMLVWSEFGRAVFFGLPDEITIMPDWIPKVHDEVGEVPVESYKVPLWNGKVPDKDSKWNKSERFLQR